METIKNYLETMFVNLPNTPEVRRAKDELGQMMEDKYQELINEGKTENEAVGIVITEFGNLDELAEDLGIGQAMSQPEFTVPRRMIGYEEAMEYIRIMSGNALRIGLGVLLCICSVMVAALVDDIENYEFLGVIWLFASVAVGVVLFILSGIKSDKFKYINKELCSIDYATCSKLKELRDNFKNSYAVMLCAGVMLCICSVVPAAVIEEANLKLNRWENLGGALLFVFVGIGVFMIVYANIRMNSYNRLIRINGTDTIGGQYKKEENVNYYPWAKAIISVYWPTAGCIYIAWSFLTFCWHITWIVWPIAAVIFSLIKVIGRREE